MKCTQVRKGKRSNTVFKIFLYTSSLVLQKILNCVEAFLSFSFPPFFSVFFHEKTIRKDLVVKHWKILEKYNTFSRSENKQKNDTKSTVFTFIITRSAWYWPLT